MKHLVVAIALLLLTSCRANPTTGEMQLDWPTVSTEVGLAEQDLRDAAEIAAQDDPSLSLTLTSLADITKTLHEAIDASLEGADVDVLVLIDQAIARADALWSAVAEEQIPSDVRATLLLTRSVLRRIRAYAVTETEPPAPPPEPEFEPDQTE